MTGPDTSSADRLKAIVLRLEALEEERDGINADMREVRKEAKGDGFDVPTITLLLKRRKLAPEDVLEADQLLETYEAAIGSGAAAAGVLSMERNAAGVFEAKILTGPAAAEEKMTKATKARRSAIELAEAARRAREAD